MTTMDEELAKGGTRRDAAERVMARLWAGETVTMTCSCGALATMTPLKGGPAPYFVTHEGGVFDLGGPRVRARDFGSPRRLRRLLMLWCKDSIDRRARLAGYRGGRLAATRLHGDWEHVPAWTKDMLERHRRSR